MKKEIQYIHEQANQANLKDKNGCYIIDRDYLSRCKGRGLTLAPLRQVSYHIEIVNSIVNATLNQTYYNPTDSFLQMEYCFPVQPDICVYRFTADFAKTRIEGVVKEQEEAQKQYSSAVREGKKAAYGAINADRDLLILKVGNVPPKESVKIQLSFLQELTLSFNTFYQLEFKKIFSPKYLDYLPGNKNYTSISNKDMLDENSFQWEFKINLKSSRKIIFYASNSHYVSLIKQNDSKTEIELSIQQNRFINKDFVFQYTTENFQLPVSVLGRTDAGSTAMISFIPKFCDLCVGDAYKAAFEGKGYQTDISHAKGEYIFLLDRSGSMAGRRIKKARQALTLFIKSLPQDSYFNVVGFGSRYKQLFEESRFYNDEDVEFTLKSIPKMSSDLGGTQIYDPLAWIFTLKLKEGYPRHIFLLTDGCVSNGPQVTKLISHNNKYARVHGIGIGSGCSEQLIIEGSAKGRGKHVFIRDDQDPSQKIIGLLADSLSPVISKIKLNFDKEVVESVIPNPEFMPYILKDQIVNFYISFKGQLSSQTSISLQYEDSLNKLPYQSELRISPDDPSQSFVDKMGHFRKIKLLEDSLKNGKNIAGQMYSLVKPQDKKSLIIKESVKHQILSQFTAFVCAQKELIDGQYQELQDKGQLHFSGEKVDYSYSDEDDRDIEQSPTYGAKSRGRGSDRSHRRLRQDHNRSRSRSPQRRARKERQSSSSSEQRLKKNKKKKKSRHTKDECLRILRKQEAEQCEPLQSFQPFEPFKPFEQDIMKSYVKQDDKGQELRFLNNCKVNYDYLSLQQQSLQTSLSSIQDKGLKREAKRPIKGQQQKDIQIASLSIHQLIGMQSTNGSWKDISIIARLFNKQVEHLVSKEVNLIAVITYLIVKWIEKHHPQKQYSLVAKKGYKFIQNSKIDSDRLSLVYDQYI